MRSYPAVVLSLLLVLAACGGGGGEAGRQPATAGPPATAEGSLVMVKGDNLFLFDPTSKQLTQLTHESNSNFANDPVFSPDGSQIAYSHHVAPQGSEWGGVEIHVMQADGSGDRTLAPSTEKGERSEHPVFTPDGSRLYFAHDVPILDQANRYTGDALSIDSVELKTGARKTVVKDAVMPTISRSGAFAWVIYNVSNSSFKLTIGNLDGSDGKVLLTEKDFQAIYSPTLSPDGQTIAFAGSGRTSSKVASTAQGLADALNPLLPGRAKAHGLPWDPWIIRADGGGLKKLASIGSDEMALSWSPNGQELAFTNSGSTYVMRADGSGLNRLLSNGDPGGLHWKA